MWKKYINRNTTVRELMIIMLKRTGNYLLHALECQIHMGGGRNS